MHPQAEAASKEAAIAELKAKAAQVTEALQHREIQRAAADEKASKLEAKVNSLAEALEKVCHIAHLLNSHLASFPCP